tara:strand:- start:2276 stop:3235 length:960 start_codon:yes stop_codon:yes gene_type:complete
VIKNLKEFAIIGVALISVSSLLLAEDSNITNTTTSTSTVTSNNTNNNTNNNTITSTSVATNNNNNVNTSTITTSATNNNTNTTNSTSDVTSNITQTQNVTNNNTSAITSTSTASNTNLNTNNSSNVNTNTSNSTSSVSTESVNQNTNQNTNLNTNNNNSTSVSRNDSTQKVTQRIKTAPPSAIAPSIMSYSQDLCTTGASSAVQTQFFGVSTGRSVRDENCETLKLSKGLYDMGMKVAAVALLCGESTGKVHRAMKMAGTPCPYNGLIGTEAQAAWDENQEDRPDWDQVKKEQASHEFKAYTKPKFCKKYPTHKICTNS